MTGPAPGSARPASARPDAGAGPPGYLSGRYVSSLEHIGRPLALAGSGGWLLRRPVAGAPGVTDACGPYPLLCCQDWHALEADLAGLTAAVSVVCVLDPMAEHEPKALERCFPDLLRPYKQHHVVDLSVPAPSRTSSHHRRNVARAARTLEVEVSTDPRAWAGDWARLYGHLGDRHGIEGAAAMQAASLQAQLEVPGTVALRALLGDHVVGMTVWYVHSSIAYYHLGASDPRGYEESASFGLFDRALARLAEDGVLWADLGGSAGVLDPGTDGLARFKRGWSTGTRTAYLGGRVLDRPAYVALSAAVSPADGFFPAYRSPGVEA